MNLDCCLDKNSKNCFFANCIMLCKFLFEIPIRFTIKLTFFYIVYESIINQVSSTISRMSCLFLSNILLQHYLVEINRSKLSGRKTEFQKAVTSMLVTEVGDEMCWWQLSDVGNGFAILVTNIHFLRSRIFIGIFEIENTIFENFGPKMYRI